MVLDPEASGTASGTPSWRLARRLTSSPVALAAAGALVLALLVEAAPLVGSDIVAQAWWASWASSVRTPVDLGWYGGVPVVSYSLLSPWAAALLGLPLLGILGTVLGTATTTALLGRLRPSPGRLTAAGLVAAVTWAADQWSGRTTFGIGAAVACLALVVAGRRAGWGARLGGAGLAAVASAVSPVAALFLLLAAAAWWWGGRPVGAGGWSTRLRAGPAAAWWIAGGALVPVGGARLLGAVGGNQPASAHQMLAALAATGLTAALVASAHRVLRAGLALTALLLLATWLIPNPVGSNSVRLVLLFAAPLVIAASRARQPVPLLAALAAGWLLPPLLVADLVPRSTAGAEARATALVQELASRGVVGRVEVVPMHSHEESLAVGRRVPDARGWLRQLDTARAPLFYDGSLNAAGYLRWLRAAGVSYVALPDGRLDYEAWPEAGLLRAGVPGLREVWSDRSWRLFEVADGGMLRGNATLVSRDRSRLVLDVPAAGRFEVAVWWSRWSSLSGPGGCVGPGDQNGWTSLTVQRPGRYVVTSAWRPTGRCG
jgi:hypothetical protein